MFKKTPIDYIVTFVVDFIVNFIILLIGNLILDTYIPLSFIGCSIIAATISSLYIFVLFLREN